MRKTTIIAGTILLLLFLNHPVLSQSLSWASSFSPSWANGNTSGTATHVGGTSLNCTATATIVGGGSFMQALGSSGSQTPTVSGATFTVPGTSNRLQVTPNYTTNTAHTNIVLTFSALATNISFKIVDIDKSDATSTTYYDRVTVTGSDGVTTYNATLSKYDAVTDPNFLVISGNVARVNTTSGQGGNTNSDATDQRGTVNVSFGTTSLHTITIRYDNAPGSDGDPASQAIAIGSVSFTQSTLPVDLVAFSGHRQQQDIILSWSAQQEINAAYYSIERSNNNGSWVPLGNVPANGNGNGIFNYSYTDINPQGSSAWLYRLKEVDVDNHFKYSTIIRIMTTGIRVSLQTYPNPFSDRVNVNLDSPFDQQVTVMIADAGGKIVSSAARNLYAGDNNFTLSSLGRLLPGIYYLQVSDASGNSLGRSQLIKD